MAKKENIKKKMSALEKVDLEIKKQAIRASKREEKRKDKNNQLDSRDRDRKHIIRSAAAILFFITTILNYTHDIPISSTIAFGVPTYTILTIDIPKNVLAIFKKPPP
jgi:hypothetical protein